MKKRNVTICIFVAVIYLTSSHGMAWTGFKDGEIHDVDYEINDDVRVDWQAPGMETTLNLLPGGAITNDYDIWACSSSHVNIYGGSVGQYLAGWHSSTIIVASGSVGHALEAWHDSRVAVSGGFIGGSLSCNNSSQVFIFGGKIGTGLCAAYNSRMTVSGVSIGIGISAGHDADDYSRIVLVGSDFDINGQSVDYGQYFQADYPSGIITGTLANGYNTPQKLGA